MQDLIKKIKQLKKEKNIFILAHIYQRPEIYDIADFVGDSLALAMIAKESKAQTILLLGVDFMAETAKIIAQDKKILMPDTAATCPMARMASFKKVNDLITQYPQASIVSYVNTYAEIKAISDICCTSSNAIEVVKSLKNKQIIFLPDMHLADYVQKNIPDKEIIFFNGFCPTHQRILENDINILKEKHFNALVLAHPECNSSILDLADFIGSTGQMEAYVKKSKNKEFIIATEIGLIKKLKKDNREKTIYTASDIAICPNMKKNTLDKIIRSLETESEEIFVDIEIAKKAKLAIEKMFLIS